MDGGIVDNDNGLLRKRVTKRIKTGNHHPRVDRLLKHRGMQIVLAIHKPSPIDAARTESGQLDDTLGLLPSVGNGGIKRKARFVKIIQIDVALGFLFL
jgi:hypothetical protein